MGSQMWESKKIDGSDKQLKHQGVRKGNFVFRKDRNENSGKWP